jgi:hypothetical protein
MMQLYLIGLSAGFATALLYASVASGSLLSVVLFYLAPLPILIAALGWSHWAALIAAVVASASLAAVFGAFFFIAFLLGIGLPAWWLGYLALLARPSATAPGGLEWYPVGHLVLWAAIISALIVTAVMINFGADEESFRASLRRGLERMFSPSERSASGRAAPEPRPELSRLIELLIVALPPAAAVLTTVTGVANLWLAKCIVKVSGRLRRPLPDLAAMQFPAAAPAITALAIAAWFLPGPAWHGRQRVLRKPVDRLRHSGVRRAARDDPRPRRPAVRAERHLCRGHRFRLAGLADVAIGPR